jgi:chorismate mutase
MSKVSVPSELLDLREQIDRLDQELVLLLAHRFVLTRKVGEIKARENLEPFDGTREQDKLQRIRALCEEHGLNPELVSEILAGIMREVVQNHERMKAQQKP